MISTCSSTPARQPSTSRQHSAPSQGQQVASDFPFDLTTLDTAREIYFLPRVDRLAAWVAAQSSTPIQVRVEAEGQFIEYTLTADPAEPVVASLNGVPFEMTTRPPEEGSDSTLLLQGRSAAGDFEGDFYLMADGTQVTGLAGPHRMPINHALYPFPTAGEKEPQMESRGNFACARMMNTYWKEGDNLKLEGNLGVHNLDALLHRASDSSLVLEGTFGDMAFKQTFRPL